ncbi:MAG TPA: hypothetical protein VMD92_19635 [Acidobacteriaceae bacterium]|nr:hypothetical protein [Acidobacteriaceae bacterium]
MRARIFFPSLLFLLSGAAFGQTLGQASGPWILEKSGTTAGLRGIHAVGGGVAWASGTNGTVLRTEDGGYEWQTCAMPPGADKLDFRGIWAWDDQTAIVMSSGTGDASRLYKTTDGCSSWKLLFTNPDKDGFWDAVVFWNRDDGEILGDPVLSDVGDLKIVATGPGFSNTGKDEGKVAKKNRFATFSTWDGGNTWARTMNGFLRSDPKRSGAFAASNSSLMRLDVGWGWIGIGGQDGSFVYRGQSATDLPMSDGLSWTKVAVPITGGTDSAGVFSVAFADSRHGVAVGGDYTKPNDSAGTAAWSADGGKTWTAAAKPPHGFRSAVAWDPDLKAWIAAGTNGSDISYDDGNTWVPLDDGSWNALSLPWVVGPGGRIAKLDAGKVASAPSR